MSDSNLVTGVCSRVRGQHILLSILQYDSADRWGDDGNLLLMCEIQTVGVSSCWEIKDSK